MFRLLLGSWENSPAWVISKLMAFYCLAAFLEACFDLEPKVFQWLLWLLKLFAVQFLVGTPFPLLVLQEITITFHFIQLPHFLGLDLHILQFNGWFVVIKGFLGVCLLTCHLSCRYFRPVFVLTVIASFFWVLHPSEQLKVSFESGIQTLACLWTQINNHPPPLPSL